MSIYFSSDKEEKERIKKEKEEEKKERKKRITEKDYQRRIKNLIEAICPHCEAKFYDPITNQFNYGERMYLCPKCKKVLGFSNYDSTILESSIKQIKITIIFIIQISFTILIHKITILSIKDFFCIYYSMLNLIDINIII